MAYLLLWLMRFWASFFPPHFSNHRQEGAQGNLYVWLCEENIFFNILSPFVLVCFLYPIFTLTLKSHLCFWFSDIHLQDSVIQDICVCISDHICEKAPKHLRIFYANIYLHIFDIVFPCTIWNKNKFFKTITQKVHNSFPYTHKFIIFFRNSTMIYSNNSWFIPH